MKQLSFSDAEYGGKRKRTRREVFLAEMHRAVPWAQLEAQIAPHYPKAGGGRRPYPLATMLRIRAPGRGHLAAGRWQLVADMNIYLACTVRGDRSAVTALRGLADGHGQRSLVDVGDHGEEAPCARGRSALGASSRTACEPCSGPSARSWAIR